MEAAISVCEEPEALTILRQLRACSFITTVETEQEMRYEMLESFREFGAMQLTKEETIALRRRHLIYFSDLAQQIDRDLWSAKQAQMLNYLEREIHNYRVAQEWCLNDHVSAELVLALIPASCYAWQIQGRLSEGRQFLARLLSLPQLQAPTGGRAAALEWAGILAATQGDYAMAEEHLRESMELYRFLGDNQRLSYILANLGLFALEHEKYDAARGLCAESLTFWRNTKFVNLVLSEVALEEGDPDRAIEMCEESLSHYREAGSTMRIAQLLRILGDAARYQRDMTVASEYYRVSLSHFCEVGSNRDIVRLLWRFAAVAGAQGRAERAARLFSAATAQRDLLGLRWSPREQKQYKQALAVCSASMSDHDYAVAWHEGASWSLQQIIDQTIQA